MTLYDNDTFDIADDTARHSLTNSQQPSDPGRMPERASACSYNTGGMDCGCPGYVAAYNTDCATCGHSKSFHW